MPWACAKCGKPARIDHIGEATVEAWCAVEIEDDPHLSGDPQFSTGPTETDGSIWGGYFSGACFRCAECGAEAGKLKDLVVCGLGAACGRCGCSIAEHPERPYNPTSWPNDWPKFKRGLMPCEACDCPDYHDPVQMVAAA